MILSFDACSARVQCARHESGYNTIRFAGVLRRTTAFRETTRRSDAVAPGDAKTAVAILLFEPPPVTAQETDLSSILVNLIQNEIFLAGPPPGSPFV
jgi:hypothetical protein